MKEEKMLLIMKHIVCFNLAWQWRYLTDKTGFLFIGTHCTVNHAYILNILVIFQNKFNYIMVTFLFKRLCTLKIKLIVNKTNPHYPENVPYSFQPTRDLRNNHTCRYCHYRSHLGFRNALIYMCTQTIEGSWLKWSHGMEYRQTFGYISENGVLFKSVKPGQCKVPRCVVHAWRFNPQKKKTTNNVVMLDTFSSFS